MTIDQKFYGAACIYFEAALEPMVGKTAVAHVILNRCIIRKLTVKQVIYQPKQFSCFNENKTRPITSYLTMSQCEKAFQRAIDERLYGYNLYGCDHYHAEYMDPFPYWTKDPDMTFVKQIKTHLFYRQD